MANKKSNPNFMDRPPFEGRSQELIVDALTRASIDGLTILNAKAEILFINEPCAALYGCSSTEELVGQSWEVLFRESERARISSEVLSQMSALRYWRGQSVGRRKNKTLFYKEISARLIDESGAMVWVIRDIGEAKRAQTARKMLDQVANQLPSSLDFQKILDSLAQIAVSSLADWCTIYMNDANQKYRRVRAHHKDSSLSELMEKMSQFATPNFKEFPDFLENLKLGRSYLGEHCTPEKSEMIGSTIEHSRLIQQLGTRSFIGVPLTSGGQTIGMMIMGRGQHDLPFTVEDLSLAEELVRRAVVCMENAKLYEKAQSALKARNDFVAMVSHDLKNPLSAILLNAAFLRRNLEREIAPSQKDIHLQKQIESMEKSAQRMNNLICDFLDLSRIESGRLCIDRRNFRLQPLINDALEMLAPLAGTKSISLSTCFETSTEYGFFDRERIFQVLSNLIGNAVKFTPEKGFIKVGVRQVDHELIFYVQDSGQGIPGHQRPHVFDLYWQAKENYRAGSGLGLSIAKGLVEAHGGRIWLESEVNRGSVFYFSLPHPLSANA